MRADKEKYNEMFSQVHSSFEFNREVFEMNRRKKKAVRRLAVTAASLAIIAGIGGTAYASHTLGLKELLIKKGSTTKVENPIQTTHNPDGEFTEPPVEEPMDLINMSGWADSNEGKAVSEWTEFTDSYDKDGAIIAKVGNDPTGFEDKYGMYLVYSQEMADKLDEITGKYNLKLHQSMDDFYDNNDLIQLVNGDFMGSKNQVESGYVYNDGSFHYDGMFTLDNGNQVNYQFSDMKKGYFSEPVLNVGDANEYEEWNYQTKNGEEVYLALGKEKGLIITERKESFVAVNVLAGTEEGFLGDYPSISKEELEEMADSFDFSVLK